MAMAMVLGLLLSKHQRLLRYVNSGYVADPTSKRRKRLEAGVGYSPSSH